MSFLKIRSGSSSNLNNNNNLRLTLARSFLGNLKNDEKFDPRIRNVGILITIPMVFAAGPIVGFLIGYWLDQKFGSDPWGKTILSLLGFVASIRQVVELIKDATKDTNH